MTVTLLPVRAERTRHRPYALLAGLQIADVALTGWILHHWTARAEGNPVAAFMLDRAGLWVGLALLLVAKLAVVWVFYDCQTRVRLALALYTAVLVNNTLFLLLWALQ